MPQNARRILALYALIRISLTLTIRLGFIPHVELAKTKVAKCNVSSIVEQNVLRLKIAIDDIEPVQTFQCAHELSGVKPCSVDVESLLFLQMVEQFSSIDECKHKVQLVR